MSPSYNVLDPVDDLDDELDETMSYVSTTFTEADAQSLSPDQCPGTPKLPVGQTPRAGDTDNEWKHPKFYLSDFVDVQVQGTLYRVPRAVMQQSEIFKNNLAADKAISSLYVNEITTQEMEAFLDVSDTRVITGDDHFIFEQWAGALATANRLGIPQIRGYVTQRLQGALNRLDPFDCVDVATKYRAHEWLFQPFLRICERPEALSPAEVLRLGSERTSAICRVREKLFVHKHESTKAWIDKKWSNNRSGYNYGSVTQPDWAAMTKAQVAEQAVEAKRLIELETVLSKPDFQLPSLQSTPDTVPQAMPHPKYWQTDLRTIKAGAVRNCLYQLPTRYFEQPSLLGEDISSDSGDLLMMSHDVMVSDWNVFLDILTARPFDEPLLSLGFSSWETGLRLAVRFGHDSARRYILQRIETDFPNQDPVDLLGAAEIADAPHSDWLQGLYRVLSERKGSLSPDEIGRIGKKATAEVWKLRDQYMWNAGQRGTRNVF